jgi:hypothetical protein
MNYEPGSYNNIFGQTIVGLNFLKKEVCIFNFIPK